MATTAFEIQPDLSRTKECVFITTHFYMGIGKMKQIRHLEVVTDADKSQLRHQKKLIDSPELEDIRSQDGKLKRYLESKTCRYSDSTGFLPQVFLAEVDRVILAYQKIRRPALVAKFMAKYREMEATDFAELRESLGEHFVRGDYPPADVVEQGFGFTFYYRPVGKVNLEGISDVIVAREAEKEAAIRMQAVIEWRDALRMAGAAAVDTLFEALKPSPDGKRKKLFDSTVEKVQEYLDTYNPRDLANDTEWHGHVDKLRKLMDGVSTEKLRNSEFLKDRVAGQLEALRKDMSALVQVTGRKFR